MTKSYKMVLLEALLEADALPRRDGPCAPRRAEPRSARAVPRAAPGYPRCPGARGWQSTRPVARWRSYWRTNPVQAWCGTAQNPGRWFELRDGKFAFKVTVPPEVAGAFTAIVRELVDYRLAQYRNRVRETAGENEFICKIISNGRDPILKLPDRARIP